MQAFGHQYIHLPITDSSNLEAWRLIREGKISEGWIIHADFQTMGKGQGGRHWESAEGQNLTFSIVLQPVFLEPARQFLLNMAVSLAVKEAITHVSGRQDIWLKWPNDIYYNGNKLGGILIENIVSQKGIEIALVGIGLNINQVEFAFPGPTSLARLSGGIYDKEEVFKLIVKSIETHYMRLKRGEKRVLRQSFIQHLYRFNLWASYDDGENFEERIVGITEEGKLILEKEHQVRNQYGFKEVKFL